MRRTPKGGAACRGLSGDSESAFLGRGSCAPDFSIARYTRRISLSRAREERFARVRRSHEMTGWRVWRVGRCGVPARLGRRGRRHRPTAKCRSARPAATFRPSGADPFGCAQGRLRGALRGCCTVILFGRGRCSCCLLGDDGLAGLPGRATLRPWTGGSLGNRRVGGGWNAGAHAVRQVVTLAVLLPPILRRSSSG
jgi:hypothetical protein